MTDQIQCIQKALRYVEENLTNPLEIQEIAKEAGLSPFYFQRIFAAVCRINVGEYIRNRRLSMACEELRTTQVKVIDLAAKYGYESPDSFSRAFQRLFGIAPSVVRKYGSSLPLVMPLVIQEIQEDESMLEYKLVSKPAFTVVGISRKFHPETSYQQIPEFWDHLMQQPDIAIEGNFGICVDTGTEAGEFDYWIADAYNSGDAVPEGCELLEICAHTWAVFPCTLKTLQTVNTQMWQQWLPQCREYRLAGQYNVEYYGAFCQENPGKTYTELWLPVEPV
ncbi:MAG: AraC family transcriptional regulator [Oscillospiraceae bacterium]|nr:AraC family transcriptional regulator [Oscillospiraceae bacterium]